MDGLLYEPRAFWSVARIDSGAEVQPRPPYTVRLPRDHFYNGEKYPVVITKVLTAPVNYQFQQYSRTGFALDASTFRNDGVSASEYTRLVISAPQRQYYVRQPGHTQGLTPRPSYQPTPAGAAFGTPDQVSSLWGVQRWAFDRPMIIPKLGDLEFDLTSLSGPQNVPGVGPVTTPPKAWVRFEDVDAGLFNGNARDVQLPVRFYDDTTGSQPPFQPDGFGPAQGDATTLWPSVSRFSARRYGAENTTSDGSIPVTGFSVLLDQIGMDDQLIAASLLPGNFDPTSIITPVGMNIGARARMRNGGTGSYWWRQGAPLALVCPTITPAQVYELPEPITLGPGDRLDVEVSAPGPVVINEQTVGSIYQIGVSLCGYAVIEA